MLFKPLPEFMTDAELEAELQKLLKKHRTSLREHRRFMQVHDEWMVRSEIRWKSMMEKIKKLNQDEDWESVFEESKSLAAKAQEVSRELKFQVEEIVRKLLGKPSKVMRLRFVEMPLGTPRPKPTAREMFERGKELDAEQTEKEASDDKERIQKSIARHQRKLLKRSWHDQ